MALQHATLVRLEGKYAIVLCRMETPEKQKLCAYLQCRKDELIDLMRAYEKKQPVAFTDYGTLLWHGFCENPPEDIRRRMQPDA